MKKIKVILGFLGMALLVISCGSISFAAVEVPEKVRIGIYYEGTAASALPVSAVKGLQLGFVKDGKFTVLYEEPSASNVTVRKDAFYIYGSNTFTEYVPGKAGTLSGNSYGPYHVQIGGVYADYAAMNLQLQAIKQKGIAAYPVFADSWQVWTGFYTDANAAQADISNNIQKKLGNGGYSVVQPAENRIVAASGTGEGVMIFGGNTAVFQIRPKADNNPYMLKINNKNYRGDMEIRRFSGSDMTVINVLSLEQYLYGVIPGEIESGASAEVLKAQAVAARTYTLNNLGKLSQWDFDMDNTTRCQIYKGYDGEAASTNKAVDDTKGKLVLYNGGLAQVFYFSSSGGRTEDAKNVWGSEIPYLKSVEDKYESEKSKHYTWELTLTPEKIKGLLKAKGYDLGDITGMYVAKASEAGRATELIIQGTKSQKIFKNSECRAVLGLDSQWFTISSGASTGSDISIKGNNALLAKVQGTETKVMTLSGLKTVAANAGLSFLGAEKQMKSSVSAATTEGYKISGKGWGHGVGMSQEGAKGMANAGFTYNQILEYYFQGTKVE